MRQLLFCALLAVLPIAAQPSAPPPGPPQPYSAMTAKQRVAWFTRDTFGFRSLLIADPAVSAWRTYRGRPDEWSKDAQGFGKRYASRVSINAITNGVEGGLGAIWGEDPRYFRRATGNVSGRIGAAAKQMFLSRYADGNYRFGAAKASGIVAASFGQKLFMPDSVTSNNDCSIRVGGYYAARFLSNIFEEFRPEFRKLFRRK